jgi:VanZ family protein
MSNKWYGRIMSIVCIFFICFIFYMSSDSNSDKKTVRLSQEIHNTVSEEIHSTENGNEVSVKQVDLLIRKSGHFIEYFAICVLLLITCEANKINLRASIGWILFICLLIANLDEFYQSFVPGRNSIVRDCLIDFGGSLTGLLIYLSIRNYMKKRSTRNMIFF